MHQLQRSWIRSQHPSAQWNLRGGKGSSAEYSMKKKSPQKIYLKNLKTPPASYISECSFLLRNTLPVTVDLLLCFTLLTSRALVVLSQSKSGIRWQSQAYGFPCRSIWLVELWFPNTSSASPTLEYDVCHFETTVPYQMNRYTHEPNIYKDTEP